MRLAELEPQFVCATDVGYRYADTLTEAQGVWFLCPVCWRQNSGSIGTHGVLVWFRDRGVADDQAPGPGRWNVSGTGYQDLTLAPSIDIGRGKDGTPTKCQNEPGWHGHVANGEVT